MYPPDRIGIKPGEGPDEDGFDEDYDEEEEDDDTAPVIPGTPSVIKNGPGGTLWTNPGTPQCYGSYSPVDIKCAKCDFKDDCYQAYLGKKKLKMEERDIKRKMHPETAIRATEVERAVFNMFDESLTVEKIVEELKSGGYEDYANKIFVRACREKYDRLLKAQGKEASTDSPFDMNMDDDDTEKRILKNAMKGSGGNEGKAGGLDTGQLFLWSLMRQDKMTAQMIAMQQQATAAQIKALEARLDGNKGGGTSGSLFGDDEIDKMIKKRIITTALFPADSAPMSEGASIVKTLIETQQLQPIVQQGFGLVEDIIQSRENPNFNPYGNDGEDRKTKRRINKPAPLKPGEKKVVKKMEKGDYVAWITKNFPKVPEKVAEVATDVVFKEEQGKVLGPKQRLKLIMRVIKLVNSIRDIGLALKHYVVTGEKTTEECASWIRKNKREYYDYIKDSAVDYDTLMAKLEPFKALSCVQPDWNYLHTTKVRTKIAEILNIIVKEGKAEAQVELDEAAEEEGEKEEDGGKEE